MMLVTGCAGFIGSHLTERLVSGEEVIGIDSFTENYPSPIKEKNLQFLKKKKNFTFIKKDVNDLQPSDMKYVKKIFHLAALPGVRASWGESFPEYVKNNILATSHLLELARKAEVEKFICASSSSVYGNPSRFPTPESTPTEPISPYGMTKLCAERLCNIYAEAYHLPIVSLRFFTVYGPRQRPDMGISKFIDSALKKKEIVIYGDGSQERDFTYISDIVDGILASSVSRLEGPLNLGSSSPVSLRHLLAIVEKETAPLNVKYAEVQKGDAEKTFADISRAKSIGFRPQVSLEQGIKKQVEWMKMNNL